jgi:hypothetical protein
MASGISGSVNAYVADALKEQGFTKFDNKLISNASSAATNAILNGRSVSDAISNSIAATALTAAIQGQVEKISDNNKAGNSIADKAEKLSADADAFYQKNFGSNSYNILSQVQVSTDYLNNKVKGYDSSVKAIDTAYNGYQVWLAKANANPGNWDIANQVNNQVNSYNNAIKSAEWYLKEEIPEAQSRYTRDIASYNTVADNYNNTFLKPLLDYTKQYDTLVSSNIELSKSLADNVIKYEENVKADYGDLVKQIGEQAVADAVNMIQQPVAEAPTGEGDSPETKTVAETNEDFPKGEDIINQPVVAPPPAPPKPAEPEVKPEQPVPVKPAPVEPEVTPVEPEPAPEEPAPVEPEVTLPPEPPKPIEPEVKPVEPEPEQPPAPEVKPEEPVPVAPTPVEPPKVTPEDEADLGVPENLDTDLLPSKEDEPPVDIPELINPTPAPPENQTPSVDSNAPEKEFETIEITAPRDPIDIPELLPGPEDEEPTYIPELIDPNPVTPTPVTPTPVTPTPVTPVIPVTPTPVTPTPPRPVTPTPPKPVTPTAESQNNLLGLLALLEKPQQQAPVQTPLADIKYFYDITGNEILPPTPIQNQKPTFEYAEGGTIEDLIRILRS